MDWLHSGLLQVDQTNALCNMQLTVPMGIFSANNCLQNSSVFKVRTTRCFGISFCNLEVWFGHGTCNEKYMAKVRWNDGPRRQRMSHCHIVMADELDPDVEYVLLNKWLGGVFFCQLGTFSSEIVTNLLRRDAKVYQVWSRLQFTFFPTNRKRGCQWNRLQSC